VRAEDVWWLPQSLRDGWRLRAERPSASHRDGRILIAGRLDRPGAFFAFPFMLFLSLLDFRPSSPSVHPSRRLVQDARQRTTTATHISFLSFPSFPSFPFFLLHRKGYPCNSGVAGKRTAPEGSNKHATQGYEQVLTKSMLAGPAAREGFFLTCQVVSIIYHLGIFRSVKGLHS
jgi:hypothetical protein